MHDQQYDKSRAELLLRKWRALIAQKEKLRLELISRPEVSPLSFSQERLFFQESLGAAWANNVVSAVRLRGKLKIGALEAALNGVIRRHEALRTRFHTVGGNAVQIIGPEWVIALESRPIASAGLQDEARAFAARRFDLSDGQPMRAELLKFGVDDHVLLLALHHIVTDGWSMGILAREISALSRSAHSTHGATRVNGRFAGCRWLRRNPNRRARNATPFSP